MDLKAARVILRDAIVKIGLDSIVLAAKELVVEKCVHLVKDIQNARIVLDARLVLDAKNVRGAKEAFLGRVQVVSKVANLERAEASQEAFVLAEDSEAVRKVVRVPTLELVLGLLILVLVLGLHRDRVEIAAASVVLSS